MHHKTYRVGLTLGLTTDTQDTTGRTLSAFQGPLPDRAALETVIPQFIGDILQTPPMYSALKIGGRKLVDLARQNIEIERPGPGRCASRPLTCFRLSRRASIPWR